MSLFSALVSGDHSLFIIINQDLRNPVLDALMLFITQLGTWWGVYAVGWVILFWRGGTRERRMALVLAPLILLTDTFPTYVLKPFFARPRPFLTLDHVRLLVDVSHHLSRYGFPSNHAVNISAACTLVALHVRKAGATAALAALAALVCFSRVYVGVHYPLDVAAGALLGTALGWTASRLSHPWINAPH